MTSCITSFFCLLGTVLFFREPERAAGEEAPTSFAKVLRDMARVFRNLRFLSFLLIFSGFWIMFWQIFYSLPFYLTETLHFRALRADRDRGRLDAHPADRAGERAGAALAADLRHDGGVRRGLGVLAAHRAWLLRGSPWWRR